MEQNDQTVQNEDQQPQQDEDQEGFDFQALGDQALQLVTEQATQHPLRTIGIAMGVGYILGGGMPSLVVRLGMLAAGRALSQAATVEGARALAGMMKDRGGDETEAQTNEGGGEQPGATSRNGHRRRRGNGQRHARHD